MEDEPDRWPNDLTPLLIRTRLLAIDDERRSLAPDDFGAKHLLNVEADGLRRALTAITAGESASVLTNWAARAGRKGAHTRDDTVERAKAAIVSAGEGGMSGSV